MSLEMSKKLCIFFAVANLALFSYNGLKWNLYFGLAMGVWAILLHFLLGKK